MQHDKKASIQWYWQDELGIIRRLQLQKHDGLKMSWLILTVDAIWNPSEQRGKCMPGERWVLHTRGISHQ